MLLKHSNSLRQNSITKKKNSGGNKILWGVRDGFPVQENGSKHRTEMNGCFSR